jgi:hypothetical protein
MTDQQLAAQIFKATESADNRFTTHFADAGTATIGEIRRQIAVAYLSGCNQTANLLVRADGSITPQQVERALKLVGDDIGLSLDRP